MGSDMKEANMLCPMKKSRQKFLDICENSSGDKIEIIDDFFLECEKEKCAWWCENKMCAVHSIAEIIRVMYRLLPIEKAEEK